MASTIAARVIGSILMAVFLVLLWRVIVVGERRREEYAAQRVTVVLGAGYALTGIAYFVQPEIVTRSPLGQAVGAVTLVLYVLYVIGGFLAMYAAARHDRTVEASALLALGSGWLLNGLALVALHPADLRWGTFGVWLIYVVRRWRELGMQRR